MVEGVFRTRFNGPDYEFKVNKIHLLDTVKSTLTKQIQIEVPASFIDEPFVDFLSSNIAVHPGKTGLKLNVTDIEENHKVELSTLESGITMNDELAVYLECNKLLDVSVVMFNS